MTGLEQRALAAARRQRLSLFLMKAFETLHPGEPPLDCGWYIQAMCYALEQVERGDERRLVITVPPRHLKSVTASVAFVAWALGRDPTLKVMVASYSQELSRQHAVQGRTVLEADWYRKLFPNTRISDGGNRALEVVTTQGGMRKGVSVGGSVTGFGADLIIVDDCMKADEVKSVAAREEVKNWFGNTLFTRLNDKQRGRMVSIQQRLHEDDLPAMLLDRGYRHLNLPAIADVQDDVPIGAERMHRRIVGDLLNPAREDRSVLDQIRRELGPAAFSAQYQQNPVVPEGNSIRMEWFRTYEERPERNYFTKVVQSWDTGMSAAPSSDFSVCTTWNFVPTDGICSMFTATGSTIPTCAMRSPDATFVDLPTVNLTLLATVFGTVRNVFERNLPPNEERAVQGQLMMMCSAYLEAVRSSGAKANRPRRASTSITTPGVSISTLEA